MTNVVDGGAPSVHIHDEAMEGPLPEGFPNTGREGKVRNIYVAGGQICLIASDRVSAFDVVSPTPIPGKGEILNDIARRELEAAEAAGIPTVCIIGLREIAEKVRPPRAVHLKWPFGHPLGEPGNRAQQLSVIHAALQALYRVREPGTILDPPWPWRRHSYSEPEDWGFSAR